MKKCPFCAEEIQDEANKCRFCGEWLKQNTMENPKEITPINKEEVNPWVSSATKKESKLNSKKMSPRKKNFLIALCLFILAKLVGYLFSGLFIEAITATLGLVAWIYFVFALLSWRFLTGRLKRLDYFLYELFFMPGLVGLVGVIREIIYKHSDVPSIIILVGSAMIALPFALLAVGGHIRRLHDLNKSGFWALLLLVPIANIILWFLLLFIKGTKGVNKYGIENNVGGFFKRVFNVI